MQCTRRLATSSLALTSAQRGRAASKAIALSVRNGNIPDAYHILNSLRLANSHFPSSSSHFQPVANAFTPDVSPRLPSHVLLHALIRNRLTSQASSLAEQMMSAGIQIRTRSFEALFASFPMTPTSPRPIISSPKSSLTIRPGNIADPSTRFALKLLLLARRSRQRRTHNMFKTLMALCFINGEIILASLLFGILVRDWQNRVQLAQSNQDPVQPDSPNLVRSTAIYDTPFPAWSHLNHICQYIHDSIPARVPSPDEDPEAFVQYSASLQALANLAHLLDRRILPIGGLAGLLQSMYNFPAGDLNVWVWDRKGIGVHKEVQAQAYFKTVLYRLALRLPQPINPALSPRESAPAPLTLQTYNTLLHYSLVHARSRRMADKILHHMLYVNHGILPSEVTINILVRAATRYGVNRQWVQSWRERFNERLGSGATKTDDRKEENETLLDIAGRYEQFNEEDNYTLSTRIAYLIAHGRPGLVADAVPVLLPGIGRSVVQRDSVIRRAVAYGPVVLTSILTALMKTGRTGLAEKVWEVMKEAEQQSWVLVSDEGEAKVTSPWCLGIEAYTVMIQVYGKEARKGAGYAHSHSPVDPRKCRVRRWGKLVRRRRSKRRGGRRRKKHRFQVGRFMGMQIYRSALKEGAMTRLKFEQLRSENGDGVLIRVVKNHLRVPLPDQRFFNAILDIVARRPGMVPRSRASWTRRKARTRLVVKRRKYVWEGKVMGMVGPDVRLREVARDIRRYGFEVPLLVRRLLVGRDEHVEAVESGKEGRIWLKTR